MNKIFVKSSSHQYEIIIGENLRFQLYKFLPKQYTSIMIVTDENVAGLYLEDLKQSLIEFKVYESILPSGEKTKSIDYFYQLQTAAIQNGLDRKSLIIALGGGVIGDLAGFVAATLFRGIDYIQVPTTILAHDSSVGGKVAINHDLGKNLIGSFYPPQAVIYDISTLKTLSQHEVRSGYAELMKEALIADEDFYEEMLQTDLTTLSSKQLLEHLRRGIEIKAKIVEADERERGDRMFLNFGHTLGHALEADLGYGAITHGEAVAIGMLFAIYLSEQILQTKLPYAAFYKWLKENNYPLNVPPMETDKLINIMKLDKKTFQNKIQLVLLKNVGEPLVKEICDQDLSHHLTKFYRELMSK